MADQLSTASRVTNALPLSAVPFLLIPYDSLTYFLGISYSQSLPATAVFSLAYIVMRGFILRTNDRTNRVLIFLLLTTGVMLITTLGNLEYEYTTSSIAYRAEHVPAALRQLSSWVMGLAIYLMFQDALLRLGAATAMKWVLRGCIPTLVLAAYQGLSGSYRIQGFSSEPSFLADMLVWSMLPASILVAAPRARKMKMTGAGLITLLGTFSSTGFIKGGFVALWYFITTKKVGRGLLAVPAIFGLLYVILTFFPNNYVFHVVGFIYNAYSDTGELTTLSMIDRFFGIVGPLSLLDQPHSWLGYGIGGDTVYFDLLFPANIVASLRLLRGDIVNIASLQGKMLMYCGVWGYGFYIAAWVCAWRGAVRGSMARFMLPAIFCGSVFSIAPFFLPYIWLWLAFAATGVEAVSRLPQANLPQLAPIAEKQRGAG